MHRSSLSPSKTPCKTEFHCWRHWHWLVSVPKCREPLHSEITFSTWKIFTIGGLDLWKPGTRPVSRQGAEGRRNCFQYLPINNVMFGLRLSCYPTPLKAGLAPSFFETKFHTILQLNNTYVRHRINFLLWYGRSCLQSLFTSPGLYCHVLAFTGRWRVFTFPVGLTRVYVSRTAHYRFKNFFHPEERHRLRHFEVI